VDPIPADLLAGILGEGAVSDGGPAPTPSAPAAAPPRSPLRSFVHYPIGTSWEKQYPEVYLIEGIVTLNAMSVLVARSCLYWGEMTEVRGNYTLKCLKYTVRLTKTECLVGDLPMAGWGIVRDAIRLIQGERMPTMRCGSNHFDAAYRQGWRGWLPDAPPQYVFPADWPGKWS
jgi:hypothetical protein